MRSGAILHRMRAAGFFLALFAMMLRAVVPQGYMLSAAEDHGIVVTLCGGGEYFLDLGDNSAGGADHAPDDNANANPHCPFALATAPTLTPPTLSVPLPQIISVAAVTHETARTDTRADATPPLPARGPPSHA